MFSIIDFATGKEVRTKLQPGDMIYYRIPSRELWMLRGTTSISLNIDSSSETKITISDVDTDEEKIIKLMAYAAGYDIENLKGLSGLTIRCYRVIGIDV